MNKKELANAYDVSDKVMQDYLRRVPDLQVKKWRQRFTPAEVIQITNHLGPFVNENFDGRNNSATQ